MKYKKQLLFFLIITFLSTLLLTVSHNILAKTLAQATPAFTALLLILTSKNIISEIRNLGVFKIGKVTWYLLAIILPFSAIGIAYLTADVLHLVSFTPWGQLSSLMEGIRWIFTFFYKFLIYIFLWPLIWSLGEEMGWRGYLQPKLTAQFGLKNSFLLTGILWALWHYIFIFWGGYYELGNTGINTIFLTITVIFMAFSIGWIRHVSQSIWPCVIFHSASNAAWQLWSYQFKALNPNYIYIAGEAGLANIIFWGVCFYFIINQIDYCSPLQSAFSPKGGEASKEIISPLRMTAQVIDN